MATGNESVKEINHGEILLQQTKATKRFSPLTRQIVAALASILCSLSAGSVVGYSAIFLPQIKNEKYLNTTTEDESWLAASAALPMAPSCILTGILMEMLGRKALNITVNIPFLLGWILIYFSNGFHMFLCGRLLQGISLGISGPLNSVYVGETTDPKYRGLFLAGVSLGYTIGVLFTHAVGGWCGWKNTTFYCGIINVITAAIFIILPESPPFLVSKGKLQDAFKAFGWLRGYSDAAVTEFNGLVASQAKSIKRNYSELVKMLMHKSFLKPLFVLVGMFFILQFIGVNVVAFYTVPIIKETMGGTIDEYMPMILLDSLRFLMGIVTCVVIEKFKKRSLFLFSGLGTGISLILLAILIYLQQYVLDKSNLYYIPLILLLSYICFSSVGLLPLPWCLIGELFPLKSRGLGSGIASTSNFLFFFIVVKIAPSMFPLIGMQGCFLIFGLVALLLSPIVYCFLPDTNNKTLEEIEEDISK